MTLHRSTTRNRRFVLAMRQQTTTCAVIAALSVTAAAGSYSGESSVSNPVTASVTTPQFVPFEFRIESTLLHASVATMSEPARGPTIAPRAAVQRSAALAAHRETWRGWSQSIGSAVVQLGDTSAGRLGALWKYLSTPAPATLTAAEPVGFFIESARASWESGDADSLRAEDAQPLTVRVNQRGEWDEPIRTRIVARAVASPDEHEMAVSVALVGQEHASIRIEARDWSANRFIAPADNHRFRDGNRFVRSDGRIELRILFNAVASIAREADVMAIDCVSIEFVPSR